MNDTNRKTVVARAATLTQFAISLLFSNPIANQPPHPCRHHIEKDKPSEYVQSVDGHGRQHDTFPTKVGVGRQRRPGISRDISTFCRREACPPGKNSTTYIRLSQETASPERTVEDSSLAETLYV